MPFITINDARIYYEEHGQGDQTIETLQQVFNNRSPLPDSTAELDIQSDLQGRYNPFPG